jgi:hypothetical protein
MRKPKDAREVVLQGGDINAGCVDVENHFTGPNTVVRRGESDLGNVVLPFVEKVTFRPDAKFKKVLVNVRGAVRLGFTLFSGFSAIRDEFTGPHTVIRHGEWELEAAGGIEIPFTSTIKFGRPRLTA